MFKKRKQTAAADPYGSQYGNQPDFPPIGTTLPSPYYGAYNPRTGVAPMPEAMPKHRMRTFFKRFFAILSIVVLLAGGFIGAKFLINASKAFNGNLFGLLQDNKLKGEDEGRVNILLAGNSADDAGHGGAELTDSIMVVSIDTKNNTAFMMSIPRDLYVDIPGHGYAKINEAYLDGKEDGYSEAGYPTGGMGLLEQVVSENFGLTLHYYALVDYSAFRQAVDAVGGIDVNIASSDPRGLYDPSRDWTKSYRAPLVKLTNGSHHLDGQEALNLARARGDAYGAYGYAQSDYTRTANQRLMLVALKDKATSAGVALNPVKISSLLDSFGNNVKTDFKTTEVRRLGDLAKKIPSDKIQSVGLNNVNGKNLLKGYTTRSGQSALIPAAGLNNFSDIQAYLEQLMAPPSSTTDSTTTSVETER